MSDLRIIVIIPTFNSAEDIEECLKSIIALKLNSVRLIVGDNNSRDNTVEIIKRNYPHVFVSQNSDNYGYAAGCNIGFGSVDSDYVVFINADTSTKDNWIYEGISRMEDNTSIGAFQPKILLYSDRCRISSTGNMANFLFFGWANEYGEFDSLDGEMRRIAFASGAAAIYRTSYLKRIGCFDESFFMYGEDLDLGLRLFISGFDSVYSSERSIYHKYIFKESPGKYSLLERNRLISLLKIYEWTTLLWIAPAFVISEVGVITKAFQEKWVKEKMESYLSVMSQIKSILRKRNFIKLTRKRTDNELIAFLEGGLRFSGFDANSSINRGNYFLDKYKEFLSRLRL